MSQRRRALALVAFGCALAVVGVATYSPTLALVLAGAVVAIFGLVAVEVRS